MSFHHAATLVAATRHVRSVTSALAPKLRWTRSITLAASVLALVAANPAGGSPPEPLHLELVKTEGVSVGTAAIAKGKLSDGEDRFTVSGLSVFQPTEVRLYSRDPTNNLRLKLGKFSWDEDYRGGETSRGGRYKAQFRTQGDLLISVSTSAANAEYALVIWAGDESAPDSGPKLVPPSEGRLSWPYRLTLIAGAFFVLAAAGFAILRKRARGVTA